MLVQAVIVRHLVGRISRIELRSLRLHKYKTTQHLSLDIHTAPFIWSGQCIYSARGSCTQYRGELVELVTPRYHIQQL